MVVRQVRGYVGIAEYPACGHMARDASGREVHRARLLKSGCLFAGFGHRAWRVTAQADAFVSADVGRYIGVRIVAGQTGYLAAALEIAPALPDADRLKAMRLAGVGHDCAIR